MSFSRAPNKANAVLNSLPNEKDKPESTSFNLTKCEESLYLAYVPYNFYAIQIYLVENVWHKFWRYHSPKKYLAGQNKERFVAWTGNSMVQYLMSYGTFFTVQAIL